MLRSDISAKAFNQSSIDQWYQWHSTLITSRHTTNKYLTEVGELLSAVQDLSIENSYWLATTYGLTWCIYTDRSGLNLFMFNKYWLSHIWSVQYLKINGCVCGCTLSYCSCIFLSDNYCHHLPRVWMSCVQQYTLYDPYQWGLRYSTL